MGKAFGLTSGTLWTLHVQSAQIPDPSATELRITAGTATLPGIGLTDAAVDLRFTVASGSAALVVTAEFTLTDWKLSDSFPYMRGYPFDQITYAAPSFVFASQQVTGFKAKAADITAEAGLNFASLLKMDQLLEQTLAFLTPSHETFPFWGTVDVSADPVMPAMRLRAELGGTLAKLPPLKLHSPFVELRVQYGAKTGKRSVVYAFGMKLDIGDGLAVDFTALLLDKPVEFVISVAADPQKAMTPDALFALLGGQTWGSAVPAPLRTALQSVAFKDLEARTSVKSPTINALTTRVGSTKPVPVFDQFTIDEFDVVWELQRDGAEWDGKLTFTTYFEFYKELFDGEFEVGISTDMRLWGGFTGKVSFAKVLQTITGGAVTPPSKTDLVLTDFALDVDVPRKDYSLYLGGDAIFDPLGTGVLVLSAVQVTLGSQASTSGRAYSAELSAMLVMAGFPLDVQAAYATGEGWDFEASMPPGASVSLKDFLQRLFPSAAIPAFLDHVAVSGIQLKAHTGGEAPASVDTGATLQLRDLSLGPLGTYTIDANAALKHVAGEKPETSGSFSFGTTIPGIGARVTIGYKFTSGASKTVTVTWGAFTAEYDLTKSVLKFSVGEATLGEVLGQVIGLVLGEDDYRLPPPWSVLNGLSLRGFAIEFDLKSTPRKASVDYELSEPLDLGFITLKGLKISKVEGKVTVELDATFIGGAPVPAFDPLDKTPDVPGSGSLVDLRLLALGQRVTVPGIEKAASIDKAVKMLADFTDTPSDGLPAGPTFDSSAPWLTGLHVLFVAGTVEVEIVFVDPLLYGLRIALAGEKAGPFKNLDFEILYKKVTDTIGVYQARITLPDSMRMLQFGTLSITLPNVGLDIYTNGDFKIDFGFPYQNDFSRSFGIQYFPFTGAGGFYFAKLTGATSTSLAKPSNPGTFDPVIEFGLGLQLGLGKDISAGIMKAGASLTVFGIIEGVIATWNPAGDSRLPAVRSSDVGKSYYYRIAGTIGIIGKIYGSIDFAIVKANLNLTVTISLQAVIEAHRKFEVAFVANVDVALTVKIDLGLFSISVHLSFSMTVRESFTLGSDTPAPWGTLGGAEAADGRALSPARYDAFVEALDFAPFGATADDDRAQIDVNFIMQPSVAGDPADAGKTAGKLVAMLYIDGPDPNAKPASPPAAGAALPPAATSFERLAETVFVWAVAAFGGKDGGRPAIGEFRTTATDRARVAAAYDYLTSTTEHRPIRYESDIVAGLFPHLSFAVQPTGKTMASAVPIPMIPQLRLRTEGVDRRFDQCTKVDDDYLKGLRAYFAELAAAYQDELEKQYAGAPAQGAADVADGGETSYTAAVFEDVVLMLARGMLRAGLDAFDAYTCLYGGKSLSAIADGLDAAGNTVSAADLAAANARLPLAASANLPLTGVAYQFTATDTFDGVMSAFGVIDPASVVTDAGNADVRGLLRTGAVLASGELRHTVTETDTFRSVSASPGWSAETLTTALLGSRDAIVPLAVLRLPSVVYKTQANDTLASVAAAFGLPIGEVGTAVRNVGGLFADPDGTLHITAPKLTALSPDQLLGQMRAAEAAAHLSGANARFLLYGMRPPAPEANGLGAPKALYDLTWQQIDLPAAQTATLSMDEAPDWIRWPDESRSVQLDISGALSLASKLLGVATTGGVPATVQSIEALPAHHDDPRRFQLRRTAVVQSAEPLPYQFGGGAPPPAAQPRLWFASSALIDALGEHRALRPALTLAVTSQGDPPVQSAPVHYDWTTSVDVQIKRNSGEPTTYEVLGADEAGTAALEALISPDDPASVAAVLFLTGANGTGQAPSGYVAAALNDARAYLVKTNLSTDTNPTGAFDDEGAAEQVPTTGLLNDPGDFLRLLWESSVTRSGGFFLTYRRGDGKGLPESVFADGDTAVLTVVAVHAADGDLVHPGVNAALIGDGFDPAHHDLSAVSAGQPVEYTATGTETLAGLAADYRIELTALAEAAAEAALDKAAQVAVTGIVHQVHGPYQGHPAIETLDEIATAYGVEAQAIKDRNPGVSFDPLAALTLLRIPDRTVTGAEYASLRAIERKFGVPVAHLAVTNADVKLFASGGKLAFTDRYVDRIGAIPPGNVGFKVTRANPGTGSQDAAPTLGAQFNLLGFGLAANVSFKATSDALPVGPTSQSAAPKSRAELHTKAIRAAEPWTYDQVLYVAGSAVEAGGSPYDGVGGYAQVMFTPRDMFGNVAASVMTEPALGPAQPQNAAPLRVGYSDAVLGLANWPGLGVDYRFRADGGSRDLVLEFAFDTSSYVHGAPPVASADPNALPDWQQRALADLRTYQAVVRQLAAEGVTVSAATTLDGETPHKLETAPFQAFAAAAVTYLTAVSKGESATPPALAPIAIPVEASQKEDLFALRVAVTVARPADQVDDAFRGGTAESCTTAVMPRLEKAGGQTRTLTAFATAFEAAYAEAPVFLKAATGRSQQRAADDDSVWVVRLRTEPGGPGDAGIGFAVAGPARYYAPRPLANVLTSRGDVPIVAYDPQTGIDWSKTTETAFTGIAMDTWGRQALEALDRFLSPDFAGAAFLIDHVDPGDNGYLQQILDVKTKLAAAIAGTVEQILTEPPPEAGAPLADAVEAMRQQILAKAAGAYTVSAIAQYAAEVSSPYRDDPANGTYAPRFYGPLSAKVTAGGSGDEEASERPWSLTVARPKLAPGASFVTTAISVVDPSAQPCLPLDLGFTLNHVEHGIEKGVDGDYLASSWLSFVIPFERQSPGAPTLDTDIGEVRIPVVLREIPGAPSLLGQDARPVDDGDADQRAAVEHAKRWRYAFTYEKDVVAQDTIDASVVFNLDDAALTYQMAPRSLDLFDYLARFITVWPAMLETMTRVLVPDELDLDPSSKAYLRARKLVADFHQLIESMPEAWAAWHAANAPEADAPTEGANPEIEFSVQESKSSTGDELVATRTLGANTAKVWDRQRGALVPMPAPELAVVDGGVEWTGELIDGTTDRFRFVHGGETLTWSRAVTMHRRQPLLGGLAGGGLDIAAFQNAWSSVRVVRNRDLVRDAEGHIVPTAAAFVYATPRIKFASRVTPRLQRDRAFDIAKFTGTARRPLVEHVRELIGLLFEGTAPKTEQFIRLDCSYEQVLGTGLPAAVVPVLLGSPTRIQADTATFAAAVSEYIVAWFGEHTPPDGTLHFTLTLFPTLSSSRLPLLQLSRLLLARSDVTDL